MVFAKGNTLGRVKRPLKEDERVIVEYCLSKLYGLKRMSRMLRKKFPNRTIKYSETYLKGQRIKTTNTKDTLKRIKKDSRYNPDKIDAYIDMTLITTRSLIDANKHSRTLKIDGQYIIMGILTDGNTTYMKLWNNTKRGELKEYFTQLLKHTLKENWEVIGIDTNAKFDNEVKTIVHPIKDNKHPYNRIVEGKIGELKKQIHKEIKAGIFPIDNIEEAKKRIRQIKEEVLNNTIEEELLQRQLTTTPTLLC
jgi:hypothetical protein